MESCPSTERASAVSYDDLAAMMEYDPFRLSDPPGLRADELSERDGRDDPAPLPSGCAEPPVLGANKARISAPPGLENEKLPERGATHRSSASADAPSEKARRSAPASVTTTAVPSEEEGEADEDVPHAPAESEPTADSFVRTPLKVTKTALAYSVRGWPSSPPLPADAPDSCMKDGLTSIARAVYDQIPLDQFGQVSSIGSMFHKKGTCYPCLFFLQAFCVKGANCTYCHLQHDGKKKKRIRMSKKVREMQAAAVAAYSQGQYDLAQGEWAVASQSGAWGL